MEEEQQQSHEGSPALATSRSKRQPAAAEDCKAAERAAAATKLPMAAAKGLCLEGL